MHGPGNYSIKTGAPGTHKTHSPDLTAAALEFIIAGYPAFLFAQSTTLRLLLPFQQHRQHRPGETGAVEIYLLG